MSSPKLDATLEALAHLLCSTYEPDDIATRAKAALVHHRVAAREFDGFEIIGPGADDESDYILLGANAGDQPIWPLDVCTAGINGGEGWPDGTWQFNRLLTLDRRAWRGKLIEYAPRMIERCILISPPHGRHVSARLPYLIQNSQLREARSQIWQSRQSGFSTEIDPGWYGTRGATKAGDEHKQERDDCDWMMRAAGGLALRRHYLWSVLLGEGVGPRARFVTDPLGVREAFRLRDIPPGRKRRTALLHWVRQHWRQSRSRSADDEAWVRAYLRGERSYVWNGLRCEIEPSGEDQARMAIPRAALPAPNRRRA